MQKIFIKRVTISCLLLLNILVLRALPIRYYGVEQLSSNLITSLCQDQQGYVWIGTEYGLNKFDGVHFTHYYNDDTNAQSLSDDIIRCLMTDHDGHLWVVSNRGVQRYDSQRDAFETMTFNGEPNANVNDLLQTPDGHLWMLSADNGIFEATNLQARPLTTINKRLQRKTDCDNMYLDARGRLWIAYRDTGLQMIDTRSSQTQHYDQEALGEKRALDIIEDADGHLIVATYTSLLLLNEQTRKFERVASFTRSSVHRLYHGVDGTLLIGTSGNGVWRVARGTFTIAPTPVATDLMDTSHGKVLAYLLDRDGNQWIGCSQRGLLLVSQKEAPFHYLPFSQMQADNGNVLRAVSADRQQHVYVCQEKGGITQIDKTGRALRHWMGETTVMTMYEDQQGTFWVGTFRNGLFRLDLQGREEWLPQTGTQRIGSVTQDREGNIYTAVFNDGLHSYTPDGKTERILADGKLQLNNPYLNTLFTDRDGRIWIGHYYGIDVYDPKTDRLADIPVDPALRPAIVYAIGQSSDGSVWVGSNKGLFQYTKEGRWKRFTTKDGLPNDNVSTLVITRDGTLWVGTYHGLAQIDTDGRFTRYYRGNGLQEWSYRRGVSAYAATGEVILGHQNGITYFMPDDITKDEFRKGITLTGMRLANADVNVTTLSGGKHIINCSLEATKDITVSYLDNTFSLRFSSMDFRDAQNVHYEFRFGGEPADQWHQTEAGRSEIFFSRLAAGNHRLIVRAYDNGVYSPEKEIMIHVSPPWYRSWWAYGCYLLLLLAVAALWWRYYWNKRQAETNEEKIKFFVDISHELRSPLTLIKSPLDKLLKTCTDPTQMRALRNIERNTNRLLMLVNQILSIRRIEKGQMTMHFAETPLSEFVDSICQDYEYQTEKRQLKLTFDNQAPDMLVWIDRDNFDKVVTNLIGNAIKYVEDGGEICVSVTQTPDGKAQLCVRDNGPGIDEAQLKKVFERFYQASARPAAGQMSYGIGLNLTQKLVVMHHGTITAHNRTDGKGSEFVVTLPIGNSHLPQEQLVDSDYYSTTPSQETRSLPVTDSDRPRRVRKKTTYHVTVVDDDEEIRNFLQTELSESYHVHVYADGQKALEGIVDTIPDLVISDVVMPGMDGFELLKRVKSSTKTSHIPVVLLTTKTEHQARIAGLEQGADAYIDKPFNLEELEVRIASLIANRIRMRGKFSGMQEQEDTVRKVELKGNDAALMERIMKAVNERLDDSDFNVEALADAVGLSRVQLHRRMKELTGITVSEFIRNLRLQQAAKLLEKGDTTVAQVTYAVGFANPTHFTSAFKKHFGVPPSEYMAKAVSKRGQS